MIELRANPSATRTIKANPRPTTSGEVSTRSSPGATWVEKNRSSNPGLPRFEAFASDLERERRHWPAPRVSGEGTSASAEGGAISSSSKRANRSGVLLSWRARPEVGTGFGEGVERNGAGW